MKLYQVDAFTNKAFGGNPAGVCLLEKEQPEAWMCAVAAEMNLSETAFLRPELNPIPIRYFTPEAEIPLCGHATLASEGLVSPQQEIRFSAPGGQLSCRAESD
jgi:PhzF family phenazine biosynthesis protein